MSGIRDGKWGRNSGIRSRMPIIVRQLQVWNLADSRGLGLQWLLPQSEGLGSVVKPTGGPVRLGQKLQKWTGDDTGLDSWTTPAATKILNLLVKSAPWEVWEAQGKRTSPHAHGAVEHGCQMGSTVNLMADPSQGQVSTGKSEPRWVAFSILIVDPDAWGQLWRGHDNVWVKFSTCNTFITFLCELPSCFPCTKMKTWRGEIREEVAQG